MDKLKDHNNYCHTHWGLSFQLYDFSIVHRTRVTNGKADVLLSRSTWPEDTANGFGAREEEIDVRDWGLG